MATAEIANQIFGKLRDGRCATETATYVAVPGNEMARWLLPAESPEIGRVLASWAPYRLWSRVAWTAVCAASQLGRTAEIPGVSVLEVEGIARCGLGIAGVARRRTADTGHLPGNAGPETKSRRAPGGSGFGHLQSSRESSADGRSQGGDTARGRGAGGAGDRGL